MTSASPFYFHPQLSKLQAQLEHFQQDAPAQAAAAQEDIKRLKAEINALQEELEEKTSRIAELEASARY
jgi:peptidoglycan hydrolase CwlO-like protein